MTNYEIIVAAFCKNKCYLTNGWKSSSNTEIFIEENIIHFRKYKN